MARSEREGISALQFFPARISITSLRNAARTCRGCPLFKEATQTVFGKGSKSAPVVLVGEQPGNEEDLRGEPFVGPAGRILDQALEAAGIPHAETYLTNVVKHFKWVARGNRRLHQKPGAREIAACLPWLDKELELLRPKILVCLGATAAQALLGPEIRVTIERGRVLPTAFADYAVPTIHPSAVLRQRTSEARRAELEGLTRDLRVVAKLLARRAS
jgi:uracil-DNA glycosylase family protein